MVVAAARGVWQGSWLGVFAVAVRPEHRRQGHARAVLAALGDWGRAQGADRAYLQLRADNDAGRALYTGMTCAYRYRYRTSVRA